MTKIVELGTAELTGRHEISLELASPEDWPSDWQPSSRHFALFLGWSEESLANALDKGFARRVTEAGIALLACWGPGAEKVHDLFDDVLAPLNQRSDAVVVTTWHEDEKLEDAVEYFLVTAHPHTEYEQTCSTWVMASLGDQDLAKRMRQAHAKVRQ